MLARTLAGLLGIAAVPAAGFAQGTYTRTSPPAYPAARMPSLADPVPNDPLARMGRAPAVGVARGEPALRQAPQPTPPPLPQPVAARPAVVQASADTPAPMPAAVPAAAPAARPSFVPTPADLGIGCADDTCDPGCCYPRAWGRVEYLLWMTSGQVLPPLVTTAPPGTPQATAGAAGAPTTATLFGGGRANSDFRSGFRIAAGVALSADGRTGIEGDFFFLADSAQRFAGSGNGLPILTRPFTNAVTGAADTELVSFPGVLAGSVTVEAKSSVIGGGFNVVHGLGCDPCGQTDLLLGYRYFSLTDDVTVTEDLTALAGSPVPAGQRFAIRDSFRTTNNFHGANVGVRTESRFGAVFVGGTAAVALGVNNQSTRIDGATTITPPGVPAQAYAGGLLAQTTNSGNYSRSAFAVLPEFAVRGGVQLTGGARVYAGYNVLYLSNVVRAGDAIDPRVNPTLLPPSTALAGQPFPAYTGKTTDFFAHGVSFGLELRY